MFLDTGKYTKSWPKRNKTNLKYAMYDIGQVLLTLEALHIYRTYIRIFKGIMFNQFYNKLNSTAISCPRSANGFKILWFTTYKYITRIIFHLGRLAFQVLLSFDFSDRSGTATEKWLPVTCTWSLCLNLTTTNISSCE